MDAGWPGSTKGMPLIQGYGMTETGPTVTVLDADDALRKIGSAGKPIMHVDIRIVDEKGYDVEGGTAGEIITRGPSTSTLGAPKPKPPALKMDGCEPEIWVASTKRAHLYN